MSWFTNVVQDQSNEQQPQQPQPAIELSSSDTSPESSEDEVNAESYSEDEVVDTTDETAPSAQACALEDAILSVVDRPTIGAQWKRMCVNCHTNALFDCWEEQAEANSGTWIKIGCHACAWETYLCSTETYLEQKAYDAKLITGLSNQRTLK